MKKIKIIIARTNTLKKIFLISLLLSTVIFYTFRFLDLKKQASAKAFSWALTKKVILIDPGHGGVDPGAVGKNNILEKDIVLKVGHQLASYLKQGGARVIMTRETDTDLSEPDLQNLYTKKRQDLERRVALANNSQADVMISIHINSYPDTGLRGAQTFYQSNSPESLKLARIIQSKLNCFLKDNSRLPLTGNYYIIKNSKIPTVIVEIGFISNPKEYKLLQNHFYQTKIAWCLFSALVKYFAGEKGVRN